MPLQILQSVCTKSRIYLTYGSYLGTVYDLNCVVFLCFFFFLLNKLYMIHLIERCMFNNNNKTIEALQRHVGPFMLILLLLFSRYTIILLLSRFVFDMYFSAATCFFNLVLFILLDSFVLSI